MPNLPFAECLQLHLLWNWQWDGNVDVKRPKRREFASLHLTVGDGSTISYVMPTIACPMGYDPLLEVHLDSLAVSTSLNDMRLVSAQTCRVSEVRVRSGLHFLTRHLDLERSTFAPEVEW